MHICRDCCTRSFLKRETVRRSSPDRDTGAEKCWEGADCRWRNALEGMLLERVSSRELRGASSLRRRAGSPRDAIRRVADDLTDSHASCRGLLVSPRLSPTPRQHSPRPEIVLGDTPLTPSRKSSSLVSFAGASAGRGVRSYSYNSITEMALSIARARARPSHWRGER